MSCYRNERERCYPPAITRVQHSTKYAQLGSKTRALQKPGTMMIMTTSRCLGSDQNRQQEALRGHDSGPSCLLL